MRQRSPMPPSRREARRRHELSVLALWLTRQPAGGCFANRGGIDGMNLDDVVYQISADSCSLVSWDFFFKSLHADFHKPILALDALTSKR